MVRLAFALHCWGVLGLAWRLDGLILHRAVHGHGIDGGGVLANICFFQRRFEGFYRAFFAVFSFVSCVSFERRQERAWGRARRWENDGPLGQGQRGVMDSEMGQRGG